MKITVGIAKNGTEISKMIQGNMYRLFGYLVVDVSDFNYHTSSFYKIDIDIQ